MKRRRLSAVPTAAPSIEALTVGHAADLLGIHPETVRRMVRRGDLPTAFRVGRQIRIPASEVSDYIDRNAARRQA